MDREELKQRSKKLKRRQQDLKMPDECLAMRSGVPVDRLPIILFEEGGEPSFHELMGRWLASRGEEAPDLEDDEAWPLSDDQLMPGMLNERQMAQLAAATGEQFDRLFLEFMILHHEGALTMVEQLFLVSGAAQEPQIFQFVSHVDADQAIEIERMGTMLRARG